MAMELNVPDALPVMTLPGTVFFPHALLPLHIFEPRYRQMLGDVLTTHRIFAVAHLNEDLAGQVAQFEPPHRIATAGIIRACQKNDNGTSDLVLQGLCRVEFAEILREEPYRFAQMRSLTSRAGADDGENRRRCQELVRLLSLRQKFGAPTPGGMAAWLRTVADPGTFVDLAAFGVCENPDVKQILLETLDVPRRLELFATHLRAEIEALKLRRKLQGPLGDDAIANN